MLYNEKTMGLIVTVISPEEYDLLVGLSGYEQIIQAENIGRRYAMTAQQIIAMLPTPSGSLSNQSKANSATTASRGFRFEYDPSREASQRRENVTQVINCSSCGAALGIPAIRPIKVTCPQCLQETTYTD